MFLNIPMIESVVCFRYAPLSFGIEIERLIAFYIQISDLEETIAPEIVNFAMHYNLAVYTSFKIANFRRCFQVIMASFKIHMKTLEERNLNESEMPLQEHEDYLKTVAILEVLGHFILCPTKIPIISEYCSIFPFTLNVNLVNASEWATRVVKSITFNEHQQSLQCVFGHYDTEIRDFDL